MLLLAEASLYFYTAWYSEEDFAAGILALKDAGCNIIVDDIGYGREVSQKQTITMGLNKTGNTYVKYSR